MPPVTVYSKPGCQPCRMTKRQLDSAGITYEEIDLTQDPSALEYVKTLGVQAAPVVVVGGGADVWAGFKPEKIQELVTLKTQAA